jgi:hypothetical protein
MKYPIGTKVINPNGSVFWELVGYNKGCPVVIFFGGTKRLTISSFYNETDRRRDRVVKLPTHEILKEYYAF